MIEIQKHLKCGARGEWQAPAGQKEQQTKRRAGQSEREKGTS